MTLDTPAIRQFINSAPKREALKLVLADPTLQEALGLLRDAAIPRFTPGPIPGNHPDTAIAHEWFRSMGIVAFGDTLRAMSEGVPLRGGELESEAFVPDEFLKTKPKTK